jgi:hypothetical protein
MEARFLYLYFYKKPPIKFRLWEPEDDSNIYDTVDYFLEQQCVDDPTLVTLEDIYLASVVTEIVRFGSLIGCY